MKPIDDTFHFTVGNTQFDDKFNAMQKNIQSGDPIRLESPASYNNYDFSNEPHESFDEILKQEAEKIRDNYKTVRVYYSGGCDSKLMLETFVKNNIHIDEIIVARSGIVEADFEQNDYALPFLKSLHLPNTQITIKTHSPEDYYKFHSMPMEEKISKKIITWDTHFRLGMQDEFYREELFDPDIANVHGYDKPRIVKENDQWYTYWMDYAIEPTSHVYQFYSVNPTLHCKQAHMFANALDRNKSTTYYSGLNYRILQDASTGRDTENVPKKTKFGSDSDYLEYKNKKIYYANYREKLALEYAVKNLPVAIDNWIDGLEYLQRYTNNNWWNHNCPELGTIGVFSKFYCLSTHNTSTLDELFPNNSIFMRNN